MTDLCKHCGKPASEHHAFEAKAKRARWPKGCVCNRDLWDAIAGPICSEYRGREDGWCKGCLHDAGCHKAKE